MRQTSFKVLVWGAASLWAVGLAFWWAQGRAGGQGWQASDGQNDPGWIPIDRVPWAKRSVYQGPQAPASGPRPASWPGSSSQIWTTANGDKVIAGQAGAVESVAQPGVSPLPAVPAAQPAVRSDLGRPAPRWAPERSAAIGSSPEGVGPFVNSQEGWEAGLPSPLASQAEGLPGGQPFEFGPRADRFSFPPSDEPAPVLFERAEALARVGTEVILAAEVMAGLDEVRADAIARLRASNGGRVPPEQLAQLDRQLKEVVRRRLEQKVQIALVVQHAARSIPAENLQRVREIAGREFERQELPRLMKLAEVRSRRELEDKLLAAGMSLEARKREWIDQALAADWLRQQIRTSTAISHEELLNYYHEHMAEFERPARVRWEQLMVRVSSYASRDEARAALARMGNEVLRGVPFAEVAKAKSEGPTATQGGLRDWTSQGSLTSAVLDRALFTLPVGELSPILEEDKVMHIVRVIERQEAQRTPFTEAQVQIREKIRKQREAAAREAYLAKLRREIPVWTAFDNEPADLAHPQPLLWR